MTMNRHQIQLINDNPNLSGAAIARLIGVDRRSVNRYRERPNWTHNGKGIPYVYDCITKDGVYKKVVYRGRTLAKGKLETVITNVDRLIYCLENNNGKLPRTLKQVVFEKLEFLK